MSFPGGLNGKASACNAGDLGSIPGLGRSLGEGNGNPLQYSYLENPRDGGAWWATVHGVAKSQTRLSDFTSLLHFTSFILSATAKCRGLTCYLTYVFKCGINIFLMFILFYLLFLVTMSIDFPCAAVSGIFMFYLLLLIEGWLLYSLVLVLLYISIDQPWVHVCPFHLKTPSLLSFNFWENSKQILSKWIFSQLRLFKTFFFFFLNLLIVWVFLCCKVISWDLSWFSCWLILEQGASLRWCFCIITSADCVLGISPYSVLAAARFSSLDLMWGNELSDERGSWILAGYLWKAPSLHLGRLLCQGPASLHTLTLPCYLFPSLTSQK